MLSAAHYGLNPNVPKDVPFYKGHGRIEKDQIYLAEKILPPLKESSS
jgi:hypothetical protein